MAFWFLDNGLEYLMHYFFLLFRTVAPHVIAIYVNPSSYFITTALSDTPPTYHLPLTIYNLPLTTYHLPLTTYHINTTENPLIQEQLSVTSSNNDIPNHPTGHGQIRPVQKAAPRPARQCSHGSRHPADHIHGSRDHRPRLDPRQAQPPNEARRIRHQAQNDASRPRSRHPTHVTPRTPRHDIRPRRHERHRSPSPSLQTSQEGVLPHALQTRHLPHRHGRGQKWTVPPLPHPP